MILGRPINLWAGLTAAVMAAIQTIGVVVLKWDAVATATVIGSIGTVLGALIALVAVQTPTVQPDSNVRVQTPSGQPNATATLGLTDSGALTVSSPDSDVIAGGVLVGTGETE